MEESEASWRHPGFEQGPTHPVVDVDWDAADAFCSWLTEREHANGTLPKQKAYRLPKDDEWSIAVGLNHEIGNSPDEKSGKIKGEYPWGAEWPPPKGVGNFYGEEAKTGNEPANWSVISGYNDGWPRTSPVGSYRANNFGLYDMAGNVWQWVEDGMMAEGGMVNGRPQIVFYFARGLRGGSWVDTKPERLLSSFRNAGEPTVGTPYIGFRCVVSDVSK